MTASTEIISQAMAFPMGHIVSKYIDEEAIPSSVAAEHEKELKRFLAMCAMNRGKKGYGMRGPVDQLWHTFITHTRDYQEFCDTIGGRFIHHIPETKEVSATEGSRGKYDQFLSDYEKVFGEVAPTHLWPRISDDKSGCDGCSGCGVD